MSAAGCASLRLAVVSPSVDRQHGTERAVAELVERFAITYGCEVHLFSQRVEGIALLSSQFADEEKGAVVWHRVPTLPGPHLLQFLVWFCFNRILRTHAEFDVVLSAGINCSDADAIIVHAVFRRVAEVSRLADKEGGGCINLLRRLHRSAYYALLKALERRFYGDSKVALAAVSQSTASLLRTYFGRGDVGVVPNGVDSAQFNPGAYQSRRVVSRSSYKIPDDVLVLLLVGNDWKVKGVGTVLQAIALLQDLPLCFIVAGADSPQPFVELARKLGILDRCVWQKPVSDVLDLYAAADLYVAPTLEDSFSLPVAEAMACGLPVVTSIFAGVAGLIHDGRDGFVLAEPTDAVALSRLIRTLASDAEMRRRTGTAAAKTAAEWTWDRSADAAWQWIEEVAARKAFPKP